MLFRSVVGGSSAAKAILMILAHAASAGTLPGCRMAQRWGRPLAGSRLHLWEPPGTSANDSPTSAAAGKDFNIFNILKSFNILQYFGPKPKTYVFLVVTTPSWPLVN